MFIYFVLENSKLVALGTVATVSGLIYGAWWYNNYLRNKPPTNWVRVGEISDLCIYPIKSLKALRPNSFECTPCGPRLGSIRDRSVLLRFTYHLIVTKDSAELIQIGIHFQDFCRRRRHGQSTVGSDLSENVSNNPHVQ